MGSAFKGMNFPQGEQILSYKRSLLLRRETNLKMAELLPLKVNL